MADRKITITHNGVTYDGVVATVERTALGKEDHGILTANMTLGWDGSGVVFGGFCLDTPGPDSGDRVGSAYGLDYVIKVLETVGVESWEQLRGTQLIALFENSRWGSPIKGIAGLATQHVFIPAEHAEQWRAEEASHG
jgi:hypothetical protein